MPDEPFRESTILTNVDHRKILKGWLPEAMVGEWRLLFRGSRDDFADSAFHTKCDNKGPTITVVKSGANIFGGFTEKPWTSPGAGRKFLLQLIIIYTSKIYPNELPDAFHALFIIIL